MNVTRIAPSPTGDMHLGTARTAYFNWLAARASGGCFILRIDDTDRARSDDAHVHTILEVMNWLGLDADMVVRQSDRLALYVDLASKLLNAKLASKEDGAVRLRNSPPPGSWDDTVTGTIRASDKDRDLADGLVLVRSDGLPTYHFASVVDDMDLGINWVIRGVDHISNTPKQLAIWRALGRIDWRARNVPPPRWSHIGLVTMSGEKLSKRDGAASMLAYRDRGVDPDAMLNFMLRLGWGPSVDDRSTSALDRDDALRLFLDGGSMRASPAGIDLAKLAALDRKHKARKRRLEAKGNDDIKCGEAAMRQARQA